MHHGNELQIFPVPPAGFHPSSPSFPVAGNRPVNILTSVGRQPYKPPEPVRETVRE